MELEPLRVKEGVHEVEVRLQLLVFHLPPLELAEIVEAVLASNRTDEFQELAALVLQHPQRPEAVVWRTTVGAGLIARDPKAPDASLWCAIRGERLSSTGLGISR